MKVGDLVTYEGSQPGYIGLALRVYSHLQEFRDVKPFPRELIDVFWNDGTTSTHDTYEIEVLNEDR